MAVMYIYGSYVYCLSLFIDVPKFPRKQLREEEFALAHGFRGLSS